MKNKTRITKAFLIAIIFSFSLSFYPFTTINAQSVKLIGDMAHSNIGFSVPLAGGLSRITGKYNNWEITINYVDSDMTKSQINARIKSASISTGDAGRDEHLCSADFFDAAKNPDITFVSDSIRKQGEAYIAYGIFQLHGISKKIMLPFNVAGKDAEGSVGFTARYMLHRSDFKIGSDSEKPSPDSFVSNFIMVEIDFIAKKPKDKSK